MPALLGLFNCLSPKKYCMWVGLQGVYPSNGVANNVCCSCFEGYEV